MSGLTTTVLKENQLNIHVLYLRLSCTKWHYVNLSRKNIKCFLNSINTQHNSDFFFNSTLMTLHYTKGTYKRFLTKTYLQKVTYRRLLTEGY